MGKPTFSSPMLYSSVFAAFTMAGCATISDGRIAKEIEAPPTAADVGPTAKRIKATPSPISLPTNSNPETIYDSVHPESQPNLWMRIRANYSLPELDTPDVDLFAQRFAKIGWLEKIAPRARQYLYLLVIEAERRKLPAELALLPIIESGLNPHARSPANAVGLCQFIPSTGKRFGLHQSAFADRRKDIACVQGMFEYLESNAALFDGDWFLALAAYNWGEGAVTKAIERNRRSGLPTDYLSLKMPSETRAYVPQLLAIKRLIADPGRYGIQLPPLENRPIIDCDVTIPKDIDVAKAASLAGISSAEFRTLNPGVKKGIIPRATHPTICLPFESAVRFSVSVAEHHGPLSSWTAHTVATRTTLISLAKHYRTTPEVIRAENDIPPGMRLKAGSTVLVPKSRTVGDIPAQVATSAITIVEPDIPDTRKVTIKVKRKDTILLIAKRHRVQPQAIKQWNPGLREPLQAGQKLVLHVPVKTKRSAGDHIKKANTHNNWTRAS